MTKHQKQLIADYFSNQLKKEQETELNLMLKNDPAARSYFRTYATMHEHLHDCGDSIGDLLNFSSNKSEQKEPKYSLLKTPGFMIGAAAVLMFCIHLLITIDSSTNETISSGTTNNNPIAVVLDHNLKGSSGIPSIKQEIWKPELFKIESGGIHLRFNNSVDVIFEGPGSFEVLSPMNIRIFKGKARTLVFNDAGKYFTIHTDNAQIVDLGTEFSVCVEPNQKPAINVISGMIEIKDSSGNKSLGIVHYDSEISRIPHAKNFENLVSLQKGQRTVEPGDLGKKRTDLLEEELLKDEALVGYFSFKPIRPWNDTISDEIHQRLPEPWQTGTGRLQNYQVIKNSVDDSPISHGVINDGKQLAGRFPSSKSLSLSKKSSAIFLKSEASFSSYTFSSWVKISQQFLSPTSFLFHSSNWDKFGKAGVRFSRASLKPKMYHWGEPYPNHLSTHQLIEPHKWCLLTYRATPTQKGTLNTQLFHNDQLHASMKLKHTRVIESGVFIFGNHYDLRRSFSCEVDFIGMWKRSLSDAEISRMYINGYPFYTDRPLARK